MARKRMAIAACIGAAIAVGAAAWAGRALTQLYVNGKPASADVRMINGRAYVPLADVAKALNMTLNTRPGGYNLDVAGGAVQVQGARQGKIGDVIFSGKWRFEVIDMAEPAEYKERYCQDGKSLTPKDPGDRLIVINCVLKNGIPETQTPILTERVSGNTAIADDQGESFAPMDYDARQESNKFGSYAATAMLPGAKVNFALVFSVPKTHKAKALVFTHLAYPDNANGKGADVRVSLVP